MRSCHLISNTKHAAGLGIFFSSAQEAGSASTDRSHLHWPIDLFFQGTPVKDVVITDKMVNTLLLDKHVDYIAAYGDQKDELVSLIGGKAGLIWHRVPTGPGNLEKSWNFKIKFKGLEKSWNSVTLYKGPWIQSKVLEYFTFLALFA